MTTTNSFFNKVIAIGFPLLLAMTAVHPHSDEHRDSLCNTLAEIDECHDDVSELRQTCQISSCSAYEVTQLMDYTNECLISDGLSVCDSIAQDKCSFPNVTSRCIDSIEGLTL